MVEIFFVVFSTLGWVGSLLFVGIYHRTSRWWRYAYGRALFTLGLVIVSFFTSSMLYNVFGADYPGRSVIRLVNLGISVPAVWYLLLALVRDGARARLTRKAVPDRSDDRQSSSQA